LRDEERRLAEAIAEVELRHNTKKEEIKQLLRANGVRRANGEGWGVNWFSAKGREIVDTKAAEAAGIDLSAFKHLGDPSDRLIVK
jgi:predicted glutamine amidotransferase